MNTLDVLTPLLTTLTAKQIVSLALTNSEVYNSLLSPYAKSIFTLHNDYPDYKSWSELISYEEFSLEQKIEDAALNNDSQTYFKLITDDVQGSLYYWIVNDRMDVIQILLSKYDVVVTYEDVKTTIDNNNLPMLKLLLTQPPNNYNYGYNDFQSYFISDASYDPLLELSIHSYPIFEYLLETYEFDNETFGDVLENLASDSNQPLNFIRLLSKYYTGNNISAIQYAIGYGNFDTATLLLDMQSNNAKYVLSNAAQSTNMDLVDLVISMGADNYNDGLIGAAAGGSIEMVQLMLDNGATSYSKAILSAARYNHIEVMEMLYPLSEGLDIDDLLHVLDMDGLLPSTFSKLLDMITLDYNSILAILIKINKLIYEFGSEWGRDFISVINYYIDDITPYIIEIIKFDNIDVIEYLMQDRKLSIDDYNYIVSLIDNRPELIELLGNYIN